MIVSCPLCKKPVLWSEENPYRPFCSARCKTSDLAAWAAESYRIEAPIPADDSEAIEAVVESLRSKEGQPEEQPEDADS